LTFKDFKLHKDILEGLDTMGFTQPTPIQEMTIPIVMEGHDLIGCAQTGTGKTAAFLLPLMHRILEKKTGDGIKALIISPTRELAQQIDQQLQGLAYFSGISSRAVYGGGSGMDFGMEKNALTSGADIIVVTPGRIISHINMGYINWSSLQFLVLDEADRMLDMGFFQDITRINSFLPEKKQSLMFSATMPEKIRKLAKTILNDPKEVSIEVSKAAKGIVQGIFHVSERDKVALIMHLLKSDKLNSVLIFGSTIKEVQALHKELKSKGKNIAAVHSGIEQKDREDAMRKFKNKELQILVATDVLSRGIDVKGIDLVINYQVPSDGEDYIHRIGRTARASSSGVAFTLVDSKQKYKLNKLESFLGSKLRVFKVPEGKLYS